MTDQEAFDIVVQHLRTQGGPSYTETNGVRRCLYRHPDGIHRCAVGVLIEDIFYSRAMEDKTVDQLLRDGQLPQLQHLPKGLLDALQCAHDGVFYVKDPACPSQYRSVYAEGFVQWAAYMEYCYSKIAEWYKLTVPQHPMVSNDQETHCIVSESHQRA